MPPTAVAVSETPAVDLDAVVAAAPVERPADVSDLFIATFPPGLAHFDYGGQIFVGITPEDDDPAAEQARHDAGVACRLVREQAEAEMRSLLTELTTTSPESLAALEAARRHADAKDELGRLDARIADLAATWRAAVEDGSDVVEVEKELVAARTGRELVEARVEVLEKAAAAARDRAESATWDRIVRAWQEGRAAARAEYEANLKEFARLAGPAYLALRQRAARLAGFENLPHEQGWRRLYRYSSG